MTLSEQLSEYIAACFTGLWVQSLEHNDALLEIAELCRQENSKPATAANRHAEKLVASKLKQG